MRKFLNISLLLVILLFSLGGCVENYYRSDIKRQKRELWYDEQKKWNVFLENYIYGITVDTDITSKIYYCLTTEVKPPLKPFNKVLYECSFSRNIEICVESKFIENYEQIIECGDKYYIKEQNSNNDLKPFSKTKK